MIIFKPMKEDVMDKKHPSLPQTLKEGTILIDASILNLFINLIRGLNMQIKTPIFVVSIILLVPFVYAASYVSEVCAVPPDPKWGKSGECIVIQSGESDKIMECCWQEQDILNPGKTITWCQRCSDTGVGECGPVYLKPTSKDFVEPPGGSVLEDPLTDSKPSDSFKDRIIKLPNKTSTLSQSNSSD
jgi:hypothetical protein